MSKVLKSWRQFGTGTRTPEEIAEEIWKHVEPILER